MSDQRATGGATPSYGGPDPAGRVMIVTGTRKGIGRQLAEHWLAAGWTVVGCSRGESDLEHERYEHVCLDVSDEPAVVNMVRGVVKQHSRLDAVINNAGIGSMNHAVLTPLSTVRRIFETNVFGTFVFCREAAKAMMRAKHGRLVNCATVATPLKLEGEAAYAASKAAIQSLTQILAYELASFGITVNAVGPTPVASDLIRNVPPEKIARLLAAQALKRMGETRDIANVVDFFLRDESDFVTGQTIFLGGIS